MSKITAYAALTTVAASDLLPIVDVSDTSMAATGTTKKIAVSDLTALTTQLDSTAADISDAGSRSAGISALAARADHVHPSPVISPADTGVLAWTSDPANLLAAAGTLTAGKVYLTAFWVRKTTTISNMSLANTNSPALTSGQNFAAIFNSSGTQMGVTADQTTAWTTGGTATVTMALTASFSASPGMYWTALLANGTTTPNFRGASGGISLIQIGQSAATSRAGLFSSGLTAMPASITPASIVQANAILHSIVMT